MISYYLICEKAKESREVQGEKASPHWGKTERWSWESCEGVNVPGLGAFSKWRFQEELTNHSEKPEGQKDFLG